VRKGAKAYFVANLTAQASALLRYILLARLLGPEQLGLAAMLILTAQFFESISDTGADRLLVQDADGDSPRLQGLVQMVLVGRGLGIALALVLSSSLLAYLYHAPTLRTSLMGLALAPLVGGLIHLDMRRVQRANDFRPESLGMIVSETISLVATTAAAVITRDHTAVIYGLVLRALALVVISHVVAKRPYRWAFGKAESLRFTAFAAPLFLNGLLLFLGSQGDRLLIGGGLGPAALGHYSAILLLIYYPSSTLAKFLGGLHLPSLARARDDAARYAFEANRFGGRTILIGIVIMVGFAIVAPVFTPLFYGAKFAQPVQIFAFLGVLQTARFLRLWPTALAVSIGKSTIVMFNNIARMVAVPVALGANYVFHSLEAIVAGFIVGEIVALVVALWLLARAGTISLSQEMARTTAFLVAGGLTIASAWAIHRHDVVAAPFLIAAVALGSAVLIRRERPVVTDSWAKATSGMVRWRTALLARR
jgi:O-antigen/teichoic acid export membrane protein